MRILLVEDDEILVEVLQKYLGKQHYAIDIATDGEMGWTYASTYTYDLIILDLSLPKLDGIILCQRFRANGYDVPILVVTARNDSEDKVKVLDAGADDYLCKPVDVIELSARIRALLRRFNSKLLPIMSWGDLQLDPCSAQVTYQQQLLTLTAKEYELLELFLSHNQEVFSIEDIIDSLWSSVEYPSKATVRSHMRHLRNKLKLAGLPKNMIETIKGQGYRLSSLSEENSIKNNSLIQGETQENKRSPSDVNTRSPSDASTRSQHLAALTVAWEKYRHKSNKQLSILEKIIKTWNTCNLNEQIEAKSIAHKLAGNLGLFGFNEASQFARKLEQMLSTDTEEKIEPLQLEITLKALRQELALDNNFPKQISHRFLEYCPLLLIIDEDREFAQILSEEAIAKGIRTEIIDNPESAQSWLEGLPNHQRPNIVFIKLIFGESNFHPQSLWQKLSLIAELNLLEPSIPVIVKGNYDRFSDRLKVARHGGAFYLKPSVTPDQIISSAQKILERSFQGKKLMILDDDIELLKMLPSLLQPWGFKLTTLDDPRKFWDVLEAVEPDLLLLDIEMPYLSGIEICKVLRTHPDWYGLPVLYLSIHQDLEIRNQVFASGANDFLNKPVVRQQLVSRIINCLGRVSN